MSSLAGAGVPTGARRSRPAWPQPYALGFCGRARPGVGALDRDGLSLRGPLPLADAGDDDDLRRALDELHRMGALAAAAVVARRLRERGARGLPRGPRPSTRENPAGLTARELEVLSSSAQGLRNADIAETPLPLRETVGHPRLGDPPEARRAHPR